MEPESSSPSASLEILIKAMAELPPDRFELALKAVEAELARIHTQMDHDHALRMKREDNRIVDAANARAHALFVWGLIAGFVLSAGMVTASVIVGLQGHIWLTALLSGPSVIVLASLFVLRRLETKQLSIVSRAQSSTLAEAAGSAANPPA